MSVMSSVGGWLKGRRGKVGGWSRRFSWMRKGRLPLPIYTGPLFDRISLSPSLLSIKVDFAHPLKSNHSSKPTNHIPNHSPWAAPSAPTPNATAPRATALAYVLPFALPLASPPCLPAPLACSPHHQCISCALGFGRQAKWDDLLLLIMAPHHFHTSCAIGID